MTATETILFMIFPRKTNRESAGIFIPAEFASMRSVLLDCCRSGLRDHIVLRAAAAAGANGTNNFATDDNWIATARCDKCVAERWQIRKEGAFAQQPFEHHRRPAIASGSSCLMLGNVN